MDNEPRGELSKAAAARAPYKRMMDFFMIVKDTFLDEKEKYEGFLEILKEAELQRMDRGVMVERMKVLFEGNRHLIMALEMLASKDKLAPDKSDTGGYQEVSHYVSKIKSRFQGTDHDSKFISTIGSYIKGSKSFSEVYREVAILFHDHIDLVDEFLIHFFPTSSGLEKSFLFLDKVKETLHNTESYRQFLLFLRIYNMDIITREQLQPLMINFLENYPDLMDELVVFLRRCKKKDGLLANVLKIVYISSESLLNQGNGGKLIRKEDWRKLMEVEDWDGDRRISLYFIDQDMKSLSQEALLAEIKEISAEEQQVISIPTIFPHLEFEYADPDIHEDLYQLIRCVCGGDISMDVWTSFLEPFLGVLSNPQCRMAYTKFIKRGAASIAESDCPVVISATTMNPKNIGSTSAPCKPGDVSGKGGLDLASLKVDDGDNKAGIEEKNSRTFYGNDTFYVLFRLHQILYERMHSAKKNSFKETGSFDNYDRFLIALGMSLHDDFYQYDRIFEDDCLALLGTQAYVLFTINNLIYSLERQLRDVAFRDVHNKLLLLYGEKFGDQVYRDHAHGLLADENLYCIQCSLQPNAPTQLSIQLIEEVEMFLECTFQE